MREFIFFLGFSILLFGEACADYILIAHGEGDNAAVVIVDLETYTSTDVTMKQFGVCTSEKTYPHCKRSVQCIQRIQNILFFYVDCPGLCAHHMPEMVVCFLESTNNKSQGLIKTSALPKQIKKYFFSGHWFYCLCKDFDVDGKQISKLYKIDMLNGKRQEPFQFNGEGDLKSFINRDGRNYVIISVLERVGSTRRTRLYHVDINNWKKNRLLRDVQGTVLSVKQKGDKLFMMLAPQPTAVGRNTRQSMISAGSLSEGTTLRTETYPGKVDGSVFSEKWIYSYGKKIANVGDNTNQTVGFVSRMADHSGSISELATFTVKNLRPVFIFVWEDKLLVGLKHDKGKDQLVSLNAMTLNETEAYYLNGHIMRRFLGRKHLFIMTACNRAVLNPRWHSCFGDMKLLIVPYEEPDKMKTLSGFGKIENLHACFSGCLSVIHSGYDQKLGYQTRLTICNPKSETLISAKIDLPGIYKFHKYTRNRLIIVSETGQDRELQMHVSFLKLTVEDDQFRVGFLKDKGIVLNGCYRKHFSLERESLKGRIIKAINENLNFFKENKDQLKKYLLLPDELKSRLKISVPQK